MVEHLSASTESGFVFSITDGCSSHNMQLALLVKTKSIWTKWVAYRAVAFAYCFSFRVYGLSLDSSIKVNEMRKNLQCPLLWHIELKVTNGGKMDQYLFGLEFQNIIEHIFPFLPP